MVVSIMLYNLVLTVGFVDKNLFSNTFTWCYSLEVFFKNLILNFLDDRIFPILGVTWTIYIYLSGTDLGGGGGGRDDLRVLNPTGILQNMQICKAFSAVHIMLLSSSRNVIA